MTAEQQFFISLLCDYVHQRDSVEPSRDLDWDRLASLAAKQNLEGMIYYQTKTFKSIPEKAAEKLREGFLSDIYLSVNTDYAYDQIAELFSQRGIEFLPFKGTLVRRYYPHPELRTMGDRDILIHHHDRKPADEAILSLGYRKFVDNHAVWTYLKKHLMFEIHDVMFYENLTNDIDYRGYFSHVWDTAERNTNKIMTLECIPDSDVHFLYTMAHTAKHVINNGMGFRAFLDMVFFVKNASLQGEEPDWEWIRKELESLKLFEFTKICFTLCKYWFDTEMPFCQEDMDAETKQVMTEKIFRDGVFGLKNEDNKGSGSAKEIRRVKQNYNLAAFRLTLHKLFPPYEDMQLIPWYAWVDGKPWLMPVAWVYRWFYCLKNKRKFSRDLLLEPYEKKDIIEARHHYLDQWGL